MGFWNNMSCDNNFQSTYQADFQRGNQVHYSLHLGGTTHNGIGRGASNVQIHESPVQRTGRVAELALGFEVNRHIPNTFSRPGGSEEPDLIFADVVPERPRTRSESRPSYHPSRAPSNRSDQAFPVESTSTMPSSTLLVGLEKEVVAITYELQKKLVPSAGRYTPQFSAPFYWKLKSQHQEANPSSKQYLTRQQVVPNPTEKGWHWHDKSYVKLPFSKFNYGRAGPKWNSIVETLEGLKSFSLEWIKADASRTQNSIDPAECFSQAVNHYSGRAYPCNFKVIKEDDGLSRRLMHALPGIIDHALKLPARLEEPIPILKRGQSHTLCLSRDLACSLLANAFLCTFPEQDDGRNLPYFNFYQLFDSSGDRGKARVKSEKLKCILDYFEQMSRDSRIHPNSVITFERRCYTKKWNWINSADLLCDIKIKASQKLEETKGMLQVDFANRQVGGGVLNEGAVQEEIRFCISPELICARLFSEPLNHDEVLVITGTAQFSSYSGYSSSFRHERLDGNVAGGRREVDNLGRQYTQVVAMDALQFKSYETDTQYKPEKIERELHKCQVGFTQGKRVTSVATGNWGCGAFNGDPQLKFLIQWMAASVHKRESMLFHANDDRQKKEFEKMAKFLASKKVTVGKLYKILMKYEAKCTSWKSSERKNIFEVVKDSVNDKSFFDGLMSLF